MDLSVQMWSGGLPLIHEGETEDSDDEEDGEREGGREGERGWEEEGSVTEEEGGEGDGWAQAQGDGWEERLIPVREAEVEVEEEEESESEESEGEEAGVRRRHVTEDGWQERYVGEEREEPDISPAPLGQADDELGASNNALDLASQEEAESVAPETDTQNLYATIPESHKAKKRMKMIKEAQKRERKARKEKLKMDQRAEKQRRKERERERKARERERKKGSTLQDEIALGNATRLHDVDTSTEEGRTHAKFIDAATAAIF